MSRLFKRTLLWVAALFAVVSIAMSAVSAWNIHRGMSQEFTTKGQSIAGILAESSIEAVLGRDAVRLQSMIDRYRQIDGVAHVLIADRNGQPLAHTFVPGIPASITELLGALSVAQSRADRGPGPPNALELEGNIEVVAPILGGMAGHIVVGMDRSSIHREVLKIIVQQQALMFALFLIAVGVCWVLIGHISRPLTELNEYATRLAATPLEEIGSLHEDFQHLAASEHDEIGALAGSFIVLEQELDQSVRQLAGSVAEQERMRTELEVAREIQTRILPAAEQLGDLDPRVDISAAIQPAREVGGDLYDCFFLGEQDDEADHGETARRLLLLVGDVAGKGVPAALFMSMTCSLFRTWAHLYERPDTLVEGVNRELSRNNEACMFVTAFCAVLDLASGRMRYCNAGHNPPLLLDGNDIQPLTCDQGIAIGAVEDAGFTSGEIQLSAGTTLLMFTDGVTEASREDGELYGEPRLRNVLKGLQREDPVRLIQKLREDISRFSGDAEQADDLTLLAVRMC